MEDLSAKPIPVTSSTTGEGPATELVFEEPAKEVVFEGKLRLSQTSLWRLQRSFYARRGVDAWASGTVPWFITNNSFIAGSYARLAYAFIEDCALAGDALSPPFDPGAPIHIIELGSGSGRFAFLFLKRMKAIIEASPRRRFRFRYVMTDFTESNLKFWSDHASFKPFVEAGLLDFALFDAENDGQLALLHSGDVLSHGTARNPVVVIANYIFDSIAQDIFRIKDGVLHESRVSVISSRPEPDPDDPAILQRASLRYEHVPVVGDSYPDPEWNAVLRAYRERLDDTSINFPVGALTCLRNLAQMSNGRMLLMSADKGYNHEEELLMREDPQLVLHGSCFSLSVDYNALATWVRNRGGFAIHTTAREATLSVTALVLGAPADACAMTRRAFADHMEGFGPIDFFLLQENIPGGASKASLGYLISVLRLSEWDPWLFYYLSASIIEQAATASAGLKRDLRRGLAKVWENYYPVGETRDVPFEIGRVFWRMNCYRDALEYYHHSTRLYGEHYITLYNMGLCHQLSGQFEEALRCFDRAIALNGSYGPAKAWRIRAQAELRS